MGGPIDPEDAIKTLDAELERGHALGDQAQTLEALQEAEKAILGRKAPLALIARELSRLSDEDRRRVGQKVHEVREALRSLIADRRQALQAERENALLDADRVDITLPGRRPRLGSLHPLVATEYRIVDIFTRMGYRVVEGPEVETDWYNFTALNIPPDHPARTEKDTVYLDVPGYEGLLLQTETSAMQIRTMEVQQPPVRL